MVAVRRWQWWSGQLVMVAREDLAVVAAGGWEAAAERYRELVMVAREALAGVAAGGWEAAAEVTATC